MNPDALAVAELVAIQHVALEPENVGMCARLKVGAEPLRALTGS